MKKNISVGIIGAGIQGISNALFLQKKGFKVTIFDREEPGSQAASYGNAGHFSPYASVPMNRPDILTDVPAMLLSTSGPLSTKMELHSKNDSMVFTIHKKLHFKKNDAYSQEYASNFRSSIASL